MVGVVVPDPETFPEYAKNKLNLKGSMEELAGNQVSLYEKSNVVWIHVFTS